MLHCSSIHSSLAACKLFMMSLFTFWYGIQASLLEYFLLFSSCHTNSELHSFIAEFSSMIFPETLLLLFWVGLIWCWMHECQSHCQAGCKYATNLCLKNFSEFRTFQLLKANAEAPRAMLVFSFKIVITRTWSLWCLHWKSPCFHLAGLKSSQNQNEVNLVVDLPARSVPGCKFKECRVLAKVR